MVMFMTNSNAKSEELLDQERRRRCSWRAQLTVRIKQSHTETFADQLHWSSRGRPRYGEAGPGKARAVRMRREDRSSRAMPHKKLRCPRQPFKTFHPNS